MVANNNERFASFLWLFRYRCNPRCKSKYSEERGGKMQRVLDAAECKGKLATLFLDCTTFIKAKLIFSCLAENTGFRHDLVMWTMDKFMPSVNAILRQLGPVVAEKLRPVLAIARQLKPPATACQSIGDVRCMALGLLWGRDLH